MTISCFDSISDFPVSDFAKLGGKIARDLKPKERFVIKHVDGFYKHILESNTHEGVYQEAAERIIFCFKECLPDVGAIVNTISNETCVEEYDRKGYIYTAPIVQLAMITSLPLERRISLEADQSLDIFVK